MKNGLFIMMFLAVLLSCNRSKENNSQVSAKIPPPDSQSVKKENVLPEVDLNKYSTDFKIFMDSLKQKSVHIVPEILEKAWSKRDFASWNEGLSYVEYDIIGDGSYKIIYDYGDMDGRWKYKDGIMTLIDSKNKSPDDNVEVFEINKFYAIYRDLQSIIDRNSAEVDSIESIFSKSDSTSTSSSEHKTKIDRLLSENQDIRNILDYAFCMKLQ